MRERGREGGREGRLTDTQIDRQTETHRQTDIQRDRKTNRPTDTQIGIGNEWKTRTIPAKWICTHNLTPVVMDRCRLRKISMVDHIALPERSNQTS